MDRKNVFVCATFVAMLMGFAGTASAQDEETTEQIDWEDAAAYAELVDTFVSAEDIEMNTYYDDAQRVLWSQPADLSVETATDALAQGSESGMMLDSFQWIVPTSLWICHEDEDDDPDCSNGHRWESGHIDFVSSAGNYATFATDSSDCAYTGVEHVHSFGNSGSSAYCNANYMGKYYKPVYTNWYTADDYDYLCFMANTYWLDDSSHVNNYTYYHTGWVARFIFYVAGAGTYYSSVKLGSCLE